MLGHRYYTSRFQRHDVHCVFVTCDQALQCRLSLSLCSKILSALWCTVLHERKFSVHANVFDSPLLDSTDFYGEQAQRHDYTINLFVFIKYGKQDKKQVSVDYTVLSGVCVLTSYPL